MSVSSKELVMNSLCKLRKEQPNQIIVIETPKGTLQVRLGDAHIYESLDGKIIIDSE